MVGNASVREKGMAGAVGTRSYTGISRKNISRSAGRSVRTSREATQPGALDLIRRRESCGQQSSSERGVVQVGFVWERNHTAEGACRRGEPRRAIVGNG